MAGHASEDGSRLELRAVLLFVDDFARALEFYTDVLGFAVSDEESGEGYVRLVDWVMLQTGGSLFELFDRRVHGGPLGIPPAGTAPARNASVPAFQVRDLDAAWQRLTARGVTTVTGIEDRDWGRYFYFADPEGNALQAYQLREPGPA